MMRTLVRIACLIALVCGIAIAIDQLFRLGDGGGVGKLVISVIVSVIALMILMFMSHAENYPARERADKIERDALRNLGAPIE